MIAYKFSTQLHPTYLYCGKICRVGLYTELFYAIVPTLFLSFFADLLSLHLVTFLKFFFILVIHVTQEYLCKTFNQ